MVTLSSLRQQVETQQGTTGLDSAQVSAIAGSGISVYETLDSLPSTGLTAGDEAFVKGNSRLYVSNGSGWYNTTLVNRTPRWQIEPNATYVITDSATPITITAKATDSDNSDLTLANQSFGSDSAQYKVTISNDSSVWTFTPRTADSVGAAVAAGNIEDSNGDFTYTFKWSDGISFVSKPVILQYAPGSSGPIVWANSNSDPYIMWTDPDDGTKRRFAYPLNGTSGGTWRYAQNYPDSPSNFSNNGSYVAVPQGIEWNGNTYTHYHMSSQWTGGNGTYEIWNTSISSPSWTNESNGATNNAGNFPL